MKFECATELKSFIKQHNLFAGFTDMNEIYSGGSSYNFCVETTNKKYLLKLINDEKRFTHLKNILQNLGILYPLSQQSFNNFFMLALPYYDGRKINSHDIDAKMIENFYAEYEKLQNALQYSDDVLEAQKLIDLVNETDKLFAANNDFCLAVIRKLFWQRFKAQLMDEPAQKSVLHGDLTINNILLKNGKIFLLDYEAVRYGAPTEDVAGLLLQLSGFRSLYGNLREFIRLYGLFNAHHSYSESEWLYGVQMFYVNLLLRRLRNPDKKRRGWRKRLCLLMILCGYWRIKNFLQK